MQTLLIESGDPMTDVAFSGYHGGKELLWKHQKAQIAIKVTSLNNVAIIKLASNPIPFGSIEFCRKVASIHNIKLPLPPNIPTSLYGIADREIRLIDNKSVIESYPIFVKPRDDVKAFPGFVAKGPKDFLLYPDVDWNNMPLFTSEVLDPIKSEWRFYVHKGKVVGVGHYTGDVFKMPSRVKELVLNVIKYYDNPPIAYSIDVGVTDRAELIEINDAWALGNYGCDYLKYTEMVISRWSQIANL